MSNNINMNPYVVYTLTCIFKVRFLNTNCIDLLTFNCCKLVNNYKQFFKGFPESFSVFYQNKPILHKDKDLVWVLPEYIPEVVDWDKVEFGCC